MRRALVFVLLLATVLAGAQVTTNTLLREMVDFETLTRRPDPFYKTAQASSYDRRSVSTANQTTEGWFANGDWGKYVRTEEREGRTEYVMADLVGPGAVVRIWSANPFGTIRFYFDGESTPRIAVKTRELLTGKVGFFTSPFGYPALRGCDLYFPIPYSRSLKITVDNTDENNATRMYYQVGYRTFAAGTHVQSFGYGDVDHGVMAEVSHDLRFPNEVSAPAGSETRSSRYNIEPRD